MLNSVPQSLPENASASLIPSVADYFVYPRQGLCVVTGIRDVEFAGAKMAMVELRPFADLKQKIQVPLGRVAASGLRHPAPLDDFIVALEEAGGRARGGGTWQHRSQAYKDKMGETHPVVLAGIVRDVLGKKRSDAYKKEEFADGKLKGLDVSYSDTLLVNQALDLIAGEMAHITGMRVHQIRSLFLRATLNPEFKVEKLVLEDIGVRRMTPANFKTTFGITIQEATKNRDAGFVVAVPSEPAILPANGTKRTAAPSSGAWPAPTRSNAIIRLRHSGSGTPNRAIEVKEDLQEIYKEHLPYLVMSGDRFKAFKLGAKTLSPGEFRLLCSVFFRKPEHRLSFEKVAADIGMSADKVQGAAESALTRLKDRARATRLTGFDKLSITSSSGTRSPRAARGSAAAKKSSTLPANIAIVTREEPHVPAKGLYRGMLLKASAVLSPEELSVLSRQALRVRNVMTIEEIAAQDETEIAKVLEIRNQAAVKLRAIYAGGSDRLMHYAPLNPYGFKAETQSKEKAPKAPKAPRTRRVAASADDKKKARDAKRIAAQQASLSDANKAVFRVEQEFAPEKGMSRGLFLKAAEKLSAEQFSVLSRLELRTARHRMSVVAIAAQDGLTSTQVIEIRNAASVLLRAQYGALHAKHANYAAFNPYKEPVVKTRQPRATVTPEERRANTNAVRIARQEKSIPAVSRAVFDAEKLFAAEKGLLRGMFFKAAEVLLPEELSVLSRMELRSGSHRLSADAVAAEDKIDVAKVIEIRNAASSKLRAAYGEVAGRKAQYSAINPYEAAVVRTPRQPKQKVIVPTGPVKVELASRIVNGHLMLSFAVPIEALKGVSNFTLGVDLKRAVSAELPEEVDVGGSIKQGKGRPSRPFSAKARVLPGRTPS